MKKLYLFLIMALSIGIISCGFTARKPKGDLTYCSYCCSGAAGLGTDYCTLIADVAGEEKVKVVLDADNRFGNPVIERTFPVDKAVVDSLSRLLDRLKVYKLDGYRVDEAICGGHSYRFNIEYSSGDKVNVFWYGHNIKEEAIVAYHSIEHFFSPWREQARKEAEIQQRVERVTEMENRYNKLLKAVRTRKSYSGIRDDADELMRYMDTKQWQEDFEADERGEFPKDLKRGVLSQDGLYNLLESEKLFLLLASEP